MRVAWALVLTLAIAAGLATYSIAQAEPLPASVTAAAHPATARPATGRPATARPAAVKAAAAPRCTRPAPTTAAQYAAALAALPASQWGGADVSVSVPMPDGRTVWLYGDTLTGRDSAHMTRFVHSTAVVQDRGCFHVSRQGAQVIPNDNSKLISWMNSGIALDSTHILVATSTHELTGTCGFCSTQVGQRGAILTVTSTGDVVFTRWVAHWPAWTNKIAWGIGMTSYGSTAVMYGISTSGLGRNLYVATATVAQAAAGTWKLGSTPVAYPVDPAGVSGWHDSRGWHALTLRGPLLAELSSTTPAGPFTSTLIGAIPAPARGQLRYRAVAHPEDRLANGQMLITVCSNWYDGRNHPIATFRPTYQSAAA